MAVVDCRSEAPVLWRRKRVFNVGSKTKTWPCRAANRAKMSLMKLLCSVRTWPARRAAVWNKETMVVPRSRTKGVYGGRRNNRKRRGWRRKEPRSHNTSCSVSMDEMKGEHWRVRRRALLFLSRRARTGIYEEGGATRERKVRASGEENLHGVGLQGPLGDSLHFFFFQILYVGAEPGVSLLWRSSKPPFTRRSTSQRTIR